MEMCSVCDLLVWDWYVRFFWLNLEWYGMWYAKVVYETVWLISQIDVWLIILSSKSLPNRSSSLQKSLQNRSETDHNRSILLDLARKWLKIASESAQNWNRLEIGSKYRTRDEIAVLNWVIGRSSDDDTVMMCTAVGWYGIGMAYHFWLILAAPLIT